MTTFFQLKLLYTILMYFLIIRGKLGMISLLYSIYLKAAVRLIANKKIYPFTLLYIYI